MIYTSYFAKIRKFPSNVSPISIARFTPKGVDIPCILELAPTKEILLKYKEDGNTDNYIKAYNEQVLDKYNTDEFISLIEKASGIKGVADSMNKHVALCCFEKSEDFCHRHLIADRLERNNIKVQELDENIIEEIKNTDNGIEKTACFTGRRPKYLFGYNDDSSYLKLTIYTYKVIKDAYDKGYRNFITGGAQGFDQLAFRAVNALKKEHPNENIKNILYLPCKSQSDKWGKDGLFGSDNYKKMLNMADKIRYISDEYTNTCLMDRNKAMIDDSSLVIALYDDKNWDNDKRVRSTSGTLNALNYAKNKHRQINQISFDEHNILDTLEVNVLNWDNDVKNNDYLFGINEGILCQQVNCKGVMGAGLAKAIYEQFPIVKEEYIKNSKINKGSLLGTYQLIDVSENLSVCNIYSQENFGNSDLTKKCYTDKNALINTIDSVCKSNPDRKIYISVNIGCGLAGANWAEIKEEITALVKKERYQNVYFIDTMQKKAFYIEQTGQLTNVFTDEELNNDNPVIDNEYDR